MATIRFQCTDHETVGDYYDFLETMLEEDGLLDKPWQMYMYSVEETGMPLDPPIKLKVCANEG